MQKLNYLSVLLRTPGNYGVYAATDTECRVAVTTPMKSLGSAERALREIAESQGMEIFRISSGELRARR